MSAVILTPLRQYMFTSELSRFSYMPSTTSSVFEIRNGAGASLLNQEYVVDGAGVITVHALDKFLSDVIEPDTQPTFSFVIDGVSIGQFVAIECNINVEATASDFLFAQFLTSMQTARDTDHLRYELLSAFNPSDEEFRVEAVYLDPMGKAMTRTFRNIPSSTTSDKIKTYNVSSVLFKAPAVGELVSYTAICGKRRATYNVVMNAMPFDPAFIFRNSFGVWETIFFVGEKTTDSQFTRLASTFDGRYQTYDIDEVLMLTASTGLMPSGSDRLARDVARSMAIYLLNDDGSTGRQVTITDCSVKATNSDELLPAFTFQYRHASSNEVEFRYVPYYRIFDLTFDMTYE